MVSNRLLLPGCNNLALMFSLRVALTTPCLFYNASCCNVDDIVLTWNTSWIILSFIVTFGIEDMHTSHYFIGIEASRLVYIVDLLLL